MIDYQRHLNPAQYEAATTLEGPVLVIAGAGSGKTRTIVYRLARLVETGVPASSILLLTFTRKAAQQMLERARLLMGQRGMGSVADGGGLAAVQGGTFHAYAYSVLRLFQPEGYGRNLTVMDGSDILAALQHCREALQAGKGDRSFPKNQTINGLLSKSRNKELPLEEILRRDASHLLPHSETVARMGDAYAVYKKEKNLLDYDDLLFALEEVLVTKPEALAYCRRRHQYIMVDEYQDTNPVQARIAGLVAGLAPDAARGAVPSGGITPGGITSDGIAPGETAPGGIEPGSMPGITSGGSFAGNIMVVGDDAQSIYAFRGADVRNILRFPDFFPGTRLIRLEENYRSTQPVLDLSNAVLERASEGYAKHLFTRREGSLLPNIVRPMSDRSEATLVAGRVIELMRGYAPGEIAVLFRSGFHSYGVEVALNKLGVPFRKYGGIRYTEASHIKDVMSFARLVLNPLDFTAFARMAEMAKGVGAKTCAKIYALLAAGDARGVEKAVARFADLAADLAFIDRLRHKASAPAALLSDVLEHYAPRMESLYPDDYPRRAQGLEQLAQIASAYTDLDLLVADLSLEDPVRAEEREESVVLSTIHSAKGLEWSAVLLLDLVEERFPSRHSLVRPEDYEEERRLMYVACTRAREVLELYVPASIYDRGSGGSIPAVPSPFVRELAPELYKEWQEGYTGGLVEKQRGAYADPFARSGRRAGGVSFAGPGIAAGPASDGMSAGVPGGVRRAVTGQSHGYGAQDDANDEPDAGFDSRAEAEASGGAIGAGSGPALPPAACGYCRHRIFGRGKIVQHLPPDKYRVNFPGIGLKVIMAAYLSMEEE